MTGIKCCIKKDIKEVLRTGKLILFFALSLGIGVFIILFTFLFTNIPDELTSQLPGVDIEALEGMITQFYPRMVAQSVGVYSYYIGVFFSLVVIILTHNLLPKELKKGRWVLPIEQGYTRKDFVTSKCIVYGLLASVSVMTGYMVYFAVANTFMIRNFMIKQAFFYAFVQGLNMFFIIAFTLLLSVCFKHSIIGAISMIATVMVGPDILGVFSFGRYLPTHMLSMVYDSRGGFGELIGPLLLNILTLAFTYIWAVNKVEKLTVSRNA